MTLQNQVHSDELIYAVLPDGMTRGALEGLLTDLRSRLGLSASLLNSLLTMIRATRPSDWGNPHVEPICSKMQQDLAHTLGKTARAVRFDEYKLEQLGLIEKRVCANGARKSVSDHFRQGMCFTPLIEKVPALLRLREQLQEHEEARRVTLYKCSAVKRNIKTLLMKLLTLMPDDADVSAARDVFVDLPRRNDAFPTLESVEEHFEAVQNLLIGLQQIDELRFDSSGGAEIDFLPLQDKKEDIISVCNENIPLRPDDKSSENDFTDADPKGSTNCLENKYGEAEVERKKDLTEIVDPERMISFGSSDFEQAVRFYQGSKAQITEQDFVLGSIDQLHRLGVHSSAYQEAVETMGDLTTAICLLIIDANMTRNSNPVQNPGGMLRAMTRQHKAGRLNLVGSLIGLDQKQKRKEKEGEL